MSAAATPDTTFADLEAALEKAKSKPAPVVPPSVSSAPAVTTAAGTFSVPYWIEECHAAYRAAAAHVFVVHDNITDYPDTTGNKGDMQMLLSTVFDTNFLQHQPKMQGKKLALPPQRVFAYYTINGGLQFVDTDSRTQFDDMLTWYAGTIGMSQNKLKGYMDSLNSPGASTMEVMVALNFAFDAYKAAVPANKPGWFTVCFFNGNFLFPAGEIAHMQADREPVAYVYNWAQDQKIGQRCRVLIVTPSLEDVHATIRGGDSGVLALRIHRPTVKDRETWMTNFMAGLAKLPVDKQEIVGGQKRNAVLFAPGVDAKVMINQAAGLNLRQMEQIVRASWQENTPIDEAMIAGRKRKAIEQTYGGLVDFVEPENGFEIIGGHEKIKEAFQQRIVSPLRRGDKRTCSAGFVLTGPPGTGKTQLALALAKVLKMNFLSANLGKLFGGLVGDTERNTRQLMSAIESAAPCVVFFDEFDFTTGGGRESGGDSGTNKRVQQALMTFLSDQGRIGKVVVIAATNRPDLLDSAMIRNGRFDALIPALPPAKGDAKGRLAILKALCIRKKVTFQKSLSQTVAESVGLGRLLNSAQIWTGAEIESVLKESISNYVDRNETELVDAYLVGKEKEPAGTLTEKWEQIPWADQQGINDKLLALNEKPVITRGDWDAAMDAVQPSTGEVDFQIDLSLLFVNNLKYCPADWKDRATKVRAGGLNNLRESRQIADQSETDYVRD